MKRTAVAFLMLPALAHADWSSPGFNAFSAEGTGMFTSRKACEGYASFNSEF